MERSSVVQQRCSVQKLAVWIGTKESHPDFRHHLPKKNIEQNHTTWLKAHFIYCVHTKGVSFFILSNVTS